MPKTREMQDLVEIEEKKAIRDFFNHVRGGMVVEVGANEPVGIYSQSWHLEEELGWKCLLVEPNPVLAEKARNSRTNSVIFECACVSRDDAGDLVLYVPLDGAEEVTGHASIGKNIDDFSYKNHKEYAVKTSTLDSLLEKENVSKIDLLSIDVEGAEMEVLKGIDLLKYRPRLILLEDKHVYLDKHGHLKNHGYKLVKRTNLNFWYIPDEETRPPQSISEKARLIKRMYLSRWWKKLKLALRDRNIRPFLTP